MDAPFAIAPDDVLAQPTRARLFGLLGELKRPAGTVELAEHLNLHPNGVRIHLQRTGWAGGWSRARAPVKRGAGPATRGRSRRTHDPEGVGPAPTPTWDGGWRARLSPARSVYATWSPPGA